MGRNDISLFKDIGTVFEITDPEIVGIDSGSTVCEFFLGVTPSLMRVAPACFRCRYNVERGTVVPYLSLRKKLMFRGLRRGCSFFSSIAFLITWALALRGFPRSARFFRSQVVKTPLLVTVQFPTQGRDRGRTGTPVRILHRLLCLLFEKLVGCFRLDLAVNDGT